MMIIQPEGESHLKKKPFFVSEQLSKLIDDFQIKFTKMMWPYAFFHLFFLTLGLFELTFFAFFFTFLSEHSLGAFALSLIFLTAFSYFILRLYYQTRKPEQLKELKKKFALKAKEILDYQEGNSECHAALADAFCRLAQSLNGREHCFYKAPKLFSRLNTTVEKISYWAHWNDVYNMKEMALNAAVEEYIKSVKCEATSLEAHTALANAYILLTSLYINPQGQEDEDEKRLAPSSIHSTAIQQKFRVAAEKAIEEFKILRDYSPNDPWIHEQLAYSYCDLHMPSEAIAEYEQILLLNPGDTEMLYKLGVLYFQSGRTAQGLHVYEQLKSSHYKKAEMLISHYGAYS
ncbi:MAG: hypothetical protein H0T62_02270 [Parachlamydiaceae bacterium]|nr:hypothetical protein [Parachlamydiaceae bacterium]